jgi:DUF4097 and DUF4098 domain-containing protein YvlB
MATHLQEKLINIDNTDSPYTAGETKNIICDTSSGNISVTLPEEEGYEYRLVNTGSGEVTLTNTVGDSGVSTLYEYESIKLLFNGSQWV